MDAQGLMEVRAKALPGPLGAQPVAIRIETAQ
jgi:hypothetical protein